MNEAGSGQDLKKHVEDITSTVLDTVDARKRSATGTRGVKAWGLGLARGSLDNPGRTGLIAGLLILLVGFIAYQISPWSVVDKAVHDYKENQDRDALVDGHVKLGTAFFRTDALEAAAKEFDDALQLEPTNPDAQRGAFKVRLFESILSRDYDPSVAEKRLEFLIDEDRNDAAAHAFRADVYQAKGDFASALEEYEVALKKDAEFAHAYLGKGTTYDQQGKPRWALAMYRRAVKLAPSNQTYLNNVAYQLFRLGKYRKAATQYYELVNLDNRFMLPYFVVAELYRVYGDLANASAVQEAVVKLLADPDARSLARNQGPWFFHVADPGKKSIPSFLTSYKTKAYYAEIGLAMTTYLLGNEHGAKVEVRRARRLALDAREREDVHRIVLYDVTLLERSQKELGLAARRFFNTLLGPPLLTRTTRNLVRAKAGELAYVPSRAPYGYRYRDQKWDPARSVLTLRFSADTGDALVFTVQEFAQPLAACNVGSTRTLQADGNRVFWNGTAAWRCQQTPAGGVVKMQVEGPNISELDLARVVASGKRIAASG